MDQQTPKQVRLTPPGGYDNVEKRNGKSVNIPRWLAVDFLHIIESALPAGYEQEECVKVMKDKLADVVAWVDGMNNARAKNRMVLVNRAAKQERLRRNKEDADMKWLNARRASKDELAMHSNHKS
jgi:hypothetical protein